MGISPIKNKTNMSESFAHSHPLYDTSTAPYYFMADIKSLACRLRPMLPRRCVVFGRFNRDYLWRRVPNFLGQDEIPALHGATGAKLTTRRATSNTDKSNGEHKNTKQKHELTQSNIQPTSFRYLLDYYGLLLCTYNLFELFLK